jgi:hypothetical protein
MMRTFTVSRVKRAWHSLFFLFFRGAIILFSLLMGCVAGWAKGTGWGEHVLLSEMALSAFGITAGTVFIILFTVMFLATPKDK